MLSGCSKRRPESFALIRSRGDIAFFGGESTKDMKIIWNVKDEKPLADFMPEILLTAKKLANSLTVYNSREKKLRGENEISGEHVSNNKTVRGALITRGVTPEKVRPLEDIKKVERKVKKLQVTKQKKIGKKK